MEEALLREAEDSASCVEACPAASELCLPVLGRDTQGPCIFVMPNGNVCDL